MNTHTSSTPAPAPERWSACRQQGRLVLSAALAPSDSTVDAVVTARFGGRTAAVTGIRLRADGTAHIGPVMVRAFARPLALEPAVTNWAAATARRAGARRVVGLAPARTELRRAS